MRASQQRLTTGCTSELLVPTSLSGSLHPFSSLSCQPDAQHCFACRSGTVAGLILVCSAVCCGGTCSRAAVRSAAVLALLLATVTVIGHCGPRTPANGAPSTLEGNTAQSCRKPGLRARPLPEGHLQVLGVRWTMATGLTCLHDPREVPGVVWPAQQACPFSELPLAIRPLPLGPPAIVFGVAPAVVRGVAAVDRVTVSCAGGGPLGGGGQWQTVSGLTTCKGL